MAGLIDGEGYIALENHRGVGGSKYPPVIKIISVDKEIIDWLKNSFGGWIEKRVYENERYNDSYCWTLKGKRVGPFLKRVRPYLKLERKRRVADIVLERVRVYEKLHNGGGRIGMWYEEDIMKRMKELYNECRRLNKRGK